ncbi:MAG: aspartate-semialdehyde dehydrogenase [Clostridia bacterium]|nr:aspartate-semialdehyde dehydrogenase [Clostridia bacterium]
MNNVYKVAIVGATGLVGRTILKVLEEKNLKNVQYTLFASSKSAGNKIEFLGQNYIVCELKEDSFDSGFDYAIFSAGASTSLKYAPIAVSKDCVVIDNSSAFRMDENVPLVVPEVNPEKIFENNGIIANPNCSTIQAMLPLKVLDDKYKIKRIVYSTYQAVSGAGKKGLEDLEKGEDGTFYNNCVPHIDVFLDDGYTKEEHKMINETRKILNEPDLPITATCVRVPVRNCHSESINVEFENEIDIYEAKTLLQNSENIILADDIENNIYPLARKADGNDEVFVGRIRRDFSVKYGLNFWCVADNLRKGAASNAVQILEKLLKH